MDKIEPLGLYVRSYKRVRANALQMKKKKGKHYEAWKKGMKKFLKTLA